MPAHRPIPHRSPEPQHPGNLRPARKRLRKARQLAHAVEVELAQLDAELGRAEAGPPADSVQVPSPDAATMTLPFTAAAPGPYFTMASGSATQADPPDVARAVPHWDAVSRTLTWQGQVVKEFRVAAVNQELILAAFQEQDWPRRIDDPLPQQKGHPPKVRLRDTVRALNKRQQLGRLRFETDGTGAGVRWRPV